MIARSAGLDGWIGYDYFVAFMADYEWPLWVCGTLPYRQQDFYTRFETEHYYLHAGFGSVILRRLDNGVRWLRIKEFDVDKDSLRLCDELMARLPELLMEEAL